MLETNDLYEIGTITKDASTTSDHLLCPAPLWAKAVPVPVVGQALCPVNLCVNTGRVKFRVSYHVVQ